MPNTSETTIKFNNFLTVFSDYCHTYREVHKAYMKGKGREGQKRYN